MRFSISIPQLDTDGLDTDGLKDYLVRAEELGFEGGWVLEFVIGEPPLIAPLEMLAYAAACTERLRLGVAVLVSSLHDPIQLASAITALRGRPGDLRDPLHRRTPADEGDLVRRATDRLRRALPAGE